MHHLHYSAHQSQLLYVYVCIQNIQSSVTHNLLWLMHFLSSTAKIRIRTFFWQILNRTSRKRTRNAAFLSTSKHFERSKIVRSVPKITWNSAYNNRACGGWSGTYTLYCTVYTKQYVRLFFTHVHCTVYLVQYTLATVPTVICKDSDYFWHSVDPQHCMLGLDDDYGMYATMHDTVQWCTPPN